MSEPLKICIQRAETRQEWNEMQDDYIQRALLSANRIEKLEAALNKIRETSNTSNLFTHKRNIEVIWEIVNETLER
jgi:hypothetical protein